DHRGIPGYEWSQSHNFHDEDHEDWVKFYAHKRDEPYTLSAKLDDWRAAVKMEIFAGDGLIFVTSKDNFSGGSEVSASFLSQRDDHYYARITYYFPDHYRLIANYELTLTLPDVTLDGFLYGQVTPAVETILTTTGMGEAITDSNGYYFMPHIAGEFHLTAISAVCPTRDAIITIPERTPKEINITLSDNSHIIVAGTSSNGAISPSGPTSVCDGMSATFKITPDYNCVVADVIVDGVSGDAISDDATADAVVTHTFGNVTVDHTIDAGFYCDPYDKYEDDDRYENANALMLNDPDHQNILGYEGRQFHNFHDNGDEDWVKFYAHARGAQYTLRVAFPGENCRPTIEIYENDGQTVIKNVNDNGWGGEVLANFSPARDGLYYARIKNYQFADYGKGTDYVLMLTLPAEAFNGFIYGQVTPAAESFITTTGRDGAITNSDGWYFMPHIAGEFDLTAISSVCPTYATALTSPTKTPVRLDITLNDSSHIITANSGPDGIISPSGPVAVCNGMSATFMMIPDYGYKVADVIVDGVSEGAIESYSFDNVTEDHTIKAKFYYDPGDRYEEDDTYENANIIMLYDQDPDHHSIPGYEWF
ncbi:MAG: hypothetical protein GY869_29875, partial [Planctomycetes bacterium]|nr:hypothetical protein [Planctomycetota bacterium]